MDLTEVEYSALNLKQFVPEYEEINIQEILNFDHRAFSAFETESKIDVKKMI